MNYIKVKDVTDFVRNGASIKQDKQCSSGIPITRIETISNSQFNWDKFGYANITNDKYQDYYLKDKDVLLSHINSAKFLGRSVLFEQKNTNPIIHGMNLLCLRFRQTEYMPSFFVWYSKSQIANNYFAENTKKAVNQASITSSAIKEMPIPDFPLEAQQKIAAELDKIQSAIDNKKQQLSLLDEAVKSEFVEMFGNPIYNSKNFPTKKVIDVVTMQRGYDLPVQDRDSKGKIPVFGSNGILGNHNLAKMDKGIITGRSGTIGEVYMCETPFWPLNTTLFSNDTHGNNICYLKFLLEFFDLKRFKSGVGVPTLNRNEFHDEQIIDVPLDLQNQFAAFVQKIDKSKFVVKQQITDLQELLDSKMQEYFS